MAKKVYKKITTVRRVDGHGNYWEVQDLVRGPFGRKRWVPTNERSYTRKEYAYADLGRITEQEADSEAYHLA